MLGLHLKQQEVERDRKSRVKHSFYTESLHLMSKQLTLGF